MKIIIICMVIFSCLFLYSALKISKREDEWMEKKHSENIESQDKNSNHKGE